MATRVQNSAFSCACALAKVICDIGVVAVPTDRVLPVANKDAEDQDTDAAADEPVKALEAQSTFDDFIVWDHETLAAADDTFVKGVEEWIKFAEVVCVAVVFYPRSFVLTLFPRCTIPQRSRLRMENENTKH